MNLLDKIKQILGFQDWKESTSLPGWRARLTRKRKDRIPFQGRERKVHPCRMQTEEFDDVELRNQRFRQLRKQGTPDVSRYSTVREAGLVGGRMTYKSVWCVVYR